MELRCASKMLHGIIDGDTIEVTCKSKRCGKKEGVVVLHTFNITTGELVSTRLFHEPPGEVNTNGNSRQGASIRSAGRQADATAPDRNGFVGSVS